MARVGLNALVIYTGATFRNAGPSRYSTELIRALLERTHDHDVRVFLNPSVRVPPFPITGHTTVERTRLPTDRTTVRIAWEQLVAPARAVATRLDLLHSFLNVVPLSAPCRHVVTVHDLSFRKVPAAHPRHRRWYLNLATRASVHRASAVLADSQATKDDLVADFGADPGRVTVVYPGVEPDFHPRGEQSIAAFRATHALVRPFVLFVGTIEPRKNVDTLIRAFGRLCAEGAYAGDLVIAGGNGWGGISVEAIAARAGVGERVRRAGYVDRADLPLWYNSADLVVYPSSYEGFGIPVLEAMASGTPVITSNRSSLPEVVGDAGPTVDPRDYAQLAGIMGEVLASKERRMMMRESGLARAAQFQWSTAADICLTVYQRVLSRS